MKFVLSVLHRGPGAENIVRQVGEYQQLEEAVAAAKQVIDGVLKRAYTPGMTAEDLFEQYRLTAEIPYMTRDDEETMNANSFNHFQYAKQRADEICGGA